MATADTGSIHHAQATIGFSASLMSNKLLVGRTTQGTIRLEREILPREATRLEGNGNQRLSIATGGGLLLVGLGQRRSKLGGAYG